MKIKKGQIVAITSGDYSDYCLRDHMRALRDFDPREEVERFKREGDYLVRQRGEQTNYGAEERFMAWMTREELLEPMDPETVVELYIGGDYGELDIDIRGGDE